MFCPLGQNEHDIKKCNAQIPQIRKNLRSTNAVRGNSRLKTVIEFTLIIPFCGKLSIRDAEKVMIKRNIRSMIGYN